MARNYYPYRCNAYLREEGDEIVMCGAKAYNDLTVNRDRPIYLCNAHYVIAGFNGDIKLVMNKK